MNKIKKTILIGCAFLSFIAGSSAAVPGEQEWSDLTNHLFECYSAIVDRYEAAGVSANYLKPPSIVKPMADYIRFANYIDIIVPNFVCHTNADPSGSFETYFLQTNSSGDFINLDFPIWSVSNLHAAAGFTNWSTDVALRTWPSTNIQKEVTETLNLLKWTLSDSYIITETPSDISHGEGYGGWGVVSTNWSPMDHWGTFPQTNSFTSRGLNGAMNSSLQDDFGWMSRQYVNISGYPSGGWSTWFQRRDWSHQFNADFTTYVRSGYIGSAQGEGIDVILAGSIDLSLIASDSDVVDDHLDISSETTNITFILNKSNMFLRLDARDGAEGVTGIVDIADSTHVGPLIDASRTCGVLAGIDIWEGRPSSRKLYVYGITEPYHTDYFGYPTCLTYTYDPVTYWHVFTNSVWDPETDLGISFEQGRFNEMYSTGPETNSYIEYEGFRPAVYSPPYEGMVDYQRYWGISQAKWVLQWDFDDVQLVQSPSFEMVDSDRDDIVDIGVDVGSFGPDTGMITFLSEQDNAYVVLPIARTPLSFAGPVVHAYISQGCITNAFYSQNIASALKAEYPDEYNSNYRPYIGDYDGDGALQAFSLNTKIWESGVSTEEGKEKKQVSVIRPRGAWVVFDFPWDEAAQEFSEIGYPTGVNSNRTYVLRDTTPAYHTDLSYDIYFESGIIHSFSYYSSITLRGESLMKSRLQSISDVGGKITLFDNYNSVFRSPGLFVGFPIIYEWDEWVSQDADLDLADDERYSVSINRVSGRIEGLSYLPLYGDEQVDVSISRSGELISGINKSGFAGLELSSATIASGGSRIDYPWGSLIRSEVAGIPRKVTIVKDLLGIGFLTVESVYDDLDRKTEESVLVNDDAAVIKYFYGTDSLDRYDNGMLKSAKLAGVEYPDGSKTSYIYDLNTGWLKAEASLVDATNVRVSEYSYVRPVGDVSGDETNAMNLVERPRVVQSRYNSTLLNCVFYSYDGTSKMVTKQAQSLTAGWSSLDNLVVTNTYGLYDYDAWWWLWEDDLTYCGRLLKSSSPLGDVTYDYTVSDGALTATETHYNGQVNTTVIHPFGNIEKSQTLESGQVVAKADSSQSGYVDAFGRILRTDYLDGTHAERSNYGLYGPAETIGVDGSTTTHLYYDNGWLKSSENTSLNRKTEYAYDPMGNVIEEKVTEGSEAITITSAFDVLGRLKSRKVTPGSETTYKYYPESYGTRKVTTLPSGSQITEEYYFDGSLRKVYGDGATAKLEYQYGVDVGEYFVQEINSDKPSEWTKTYYNLLGQVARVEHPDSGSSTVASTVEYDEHARHVNTEDEMLISRRSTYNAKNEVEHAGVDIGRNGQLDLAASDRVTTSDRTVFANGAMSSLSVYPVSGSDESEQLSSILVSLDGKRIESTYAGRTSVSTRSAYTGPGAYTVTNLFSDGTMTVSSYDQWRFDKIEKFDKGLPRVRIELEEYKYYPLGQVHKVINSKTGITTYLYDTQRRLFKIIPSDPIRASSTYAYYGDTQRIRHITKSDGITTRYEYYDNGQLKRKHDGASEDVTYAYDVQGRLKSMATVQDGELKNTTWIRNEYTGLPTAKLVDGLAIESYTYRANGQPATLTRHGTPEVVTTFGYNNAGDQVSSVCSDGATSIGNVLDRMGRTTNIFISGGISESFTHTIDNIMLTDSVQGNGVIADSLMTYDYYPNSTELAAMYYAIDGAATGSYSVVYDNSVRVQAITNSQVKADYSYAADASVVTGLVMNVADVPVLEKIIDWDYTNNRSSFIEYRLNDTAVFNYSYTYEQGFDRISRILMMDGSYIQYRYDDKSRLVTAGKYDSTDRPYPGEQYSYEYDEIGNLLAGGPESNTGEPSYSFTPNSFNLHVERIWGNQIAIMGTALSNAVVTINGLPADRQDEQFRGVLQIDNASSAATSNITVIAVYNDGAKDIVAQTFGTICFPKQVETVDSSLRGFVDQDSIWDHGFNGMNRLTNSMSTFGVSVVYDYYPDGRRARKRVYEGGATPARTHEYHYDSWNLIHERITEGANIIDRSYTWGLDLAGQRSGKLGQEAGGIGGLLAIKEATSAGTKTYLPIMDHNGNIHHLVDAFTKEIVANYEYSPFGVLIGEWGEAKDVCPFRFQSKYYDKETELYYYGYRYYDARTAKWLSRDPKGEAGGINLTAFCSNDPINNWDYLGLTDYLRGYMKPGEKFADIARLNFVTGMPEVRVTPYETKWFSRKKIYANPLWQAATAKERRSVFTKELGGSWAVSGPSREDVAIQRMAEDIAPLAKTEGPAIVTAVSPALLFGGSQLYLLGKDAWGTANAWVAFQMTTGEGAIATLLSILFATGQDVPVNFRHVRTWNEFQSVARVHPTEAAKLWSMLKAMRETVAVRQSSAEFISGFAIPDMPNNFWGGAGVGARYITDTYIVPTWQDIMYNMTRDEDSK